MTAPVLFDSSVVILHANDALNDASIVFMRDAIAAGVASISVVTRAEVLAWPAHTRTSIQAAIAGMNGYEQIPVNTAIADEAARIRREHGLKLPDAMIAATATLRNIPVYTANPRDFLRVDNLVVMAI